MISYKTNKMGKSIIIIPSRLQAKRLPSKPFLKINNKPMIIHVMERAKESNVGEVIVATPDKEILDLVKKYSGNAIITSNEHETGTDRVYECLQKFTKDEIDIVINLQGDMPNLDSKNIKNLEYLMRKHKSKIGTLASKIKNFEELKNKNVVKVETFQKLNYSNFLKVKDFLRIKKNVNKKNIYHHIGIYAFTMKTLSSYVKLDRTKNELNRNLEQMRAMDNNIEIKVALSKSLPLSIDTQEDFLLIKKSMEYKG